MFTKRLRLVILVILILIAIISSCLITRKVYETFTIEPYDQYFSNLTTPDLLARNLKLPQDTTATYQEKHTTLSKDISQIDKHYQENLARLINQADDYLKEYSLLFSIPWNIKIIPNEIENGFPHTINDTIYIPLRVVETVSLQNIETLIHEKIHIFQRKNKKPTYDLYDSWGFSPSQYKHPLQRSNPDLDGINYVFTNRFIIFQMYTSSVPSDLTQSIVAAIDIQSTDKTPIPINASLLGLPKFVYQYEHPFEIMACMLSNIIMKSHKVQDEYYSKNKFYIESNKFLKKLQNKT